MLLEIMEYRSEMRMFQREGLCDWRGSVLAYGNFTVNCFILVGVFSCVFHLIAKAVGIVCQAFESIYACGSSRMLL